MIESTEMLVMKANTTFNNKYEIMIDLNQKELKLIEGGGWLCELETAVVDWWEDFSDAIEHQGILGGNAPL